MKKRQARGPQSLEDLIELWTPSEIENYTGMVANAFRTFSTDLASNPRVFTEQETQAWQDLYATFLKFYSGMSWFQKLSISTVRTAEDYVKQLAYWRQLYNSKSKIPATGPSTDIRVGPDKQLDTIKTITVAASVGVVAIAAMYLVFKFK